MDIERSKKKLVVRSGSSMPPHSKSQDTEYMYEMYLLLLGKEVKDNVVMMAGSAWMDADDEGSEIIFEYELPIQVTYYLTCLHFATGKNEKETGTLASRGMRIVGVGKVLEMLG